ncbi:alpha-tocopherol transfer protein isoform X2 [Cyclopterus lumpus]|uniref:alpha-tocopherol transfer protein isoform X2 n=1 Tax=Cyclopterus lumpus TaxID=8103 RepID=UPI0014871E5E|nr:alpha-tocopherol transfer protein isoform X2 [Cyclopterus lumpus]
MSDVMGTCPVRKAPRCDCKQIFPPAHLQSVSFLSPAAAARCQSHEAGPLSDMNGAQLSELPDDSEPLRPYVSGLRRSALRARELSAVRTFSAPFLIKFLRARDFDEELSLKLLLNYQRWRRESPEISTCLSPSSVIGLLNTTYHAVLPQRDHTGSRVLIYRIGQWNPKHWTAFQVFRVSLITSEIISTETETQRRGLKDSFPLKVRGIHLVNEPMFFRPVFAMIRLFLPDKIKQRIHMHGADFHDTLSDFFSPPVLPPEYGGEGPSIEGACQGWTNQLLQSEKLLQQIATHPTGDITITPEDALISEEGETEPLFEG